MVKSVKRILFGLPQTLSKWKAGNCEKAILIKKFIDRKNFFNSHFAAQIAVNPIQFYRWCEGKYLTFYSVDVE